MGQTQIKNGTSVILTTNELTNDSLAMQVPQFDAVIIANGLFPTHSIPLFYLSRTQYPNKPLICCDGATQKLIEYGLEPDLIIGDLDSIRADLKQKFHDRIIEISDQETNDQTKAVNYCIQKGYQKIIILAASGLREDHTLANIFLLLEYYPKIDPVMITDHGYFYVIDNKREFKCKKNAQVSIFNPLSAKINSNGLKYPLPNTRSVRLWEMTLNESISNQFSIEADRPTLLFISF